MCVCVRGGGEGAVRLRLMLINGVEQGINYVVSFPGVSYLPTSSYSSIF